MKYCSSLHALKIRHCHCGHTVIHSKVWLVSLEYRRDIIFKMFSLPRIMFTCVYNKRISHWCVDIHTQHNTQAKKNIQTTAHWSDLICAVVANKVRVFELSSGKKQTFVTPKSLSSCCTSEKCSELNLNPTNINFAHRFGLYTIRVFFFY